MPTSPRGSIRSGVYCAGNDPDPTSKARVIQRQLPPESAPKASQEADAGVCFVPALSHQPDGQIVSLEFLSSPSEFEAKKLRRRIAGMPEDVVRHFVGDDERKLIIAPGQLHHGHGDDNMVSI